MDGSTATGVAFHQLLFTITIIMILLFPSPSLSSNTEGNALFAMRSRLSDPNNVLQSWDPTLVDPCTWFHVTCDSLNHVIRLELCRNDISGEIPEELGNLKSLVSMDLDSNRIAGPIPKSFAKLKSLRFLRLNDNKLKGPIPRELTALENLEVFDVFNNDLCGTIPVDGPFATFPMTSYENNTRLNGPELKGLAKYDFGC
ncbi:Leucine-rich repeat protein 2 [Linum perenne]